MKMKNWIDSVLKNNKRFAIPIMTHPGIDLINSKVIDAVSDGITHFYAIESIQEKYPTDAVTTIMDLTVEAEAFGCEIVFSENEIPVVKERFIKNPEAIEHLGIPSLNSGRLPQYIKATQLAARNINNKPIFAGCIGPFSLAGRLFDMTEIMTTILINPEIIHNLLEKSTTFLTNYVIALKQTGANGIIMAEPAAGLLSPDLCDEFSSIYIKRIVEKVQDDNFLFILHNCGNSGPLTESMLSTGAKAIHLGNSINIIDALAKIPKDILVMGNLCPVEIFKMGTKENVKIRTMELLNNTKDYNNFIISSGCDIPPEVPEENLIQFFDTVNLFNSEK